MPTLYIRTDHVGPYPVCQWNDAPPQREDAHWALVAASSRLASFSARSKRSAGRRGG